jgi:LuxR family maltose regulon positive regulatory protein
VIQPLITTKICIPTQRSVLVSRGQLIQRLKTRGECQLTLVSAPAGFGKTTLASEWLSDTDQAVTWLSLDEGDNDPARFLTYLLTALQVIEQQAVIETGSLLKEPQIPSPELLAATLINELTAISRPFYLVIDDYHVIQTLFIHQLINSIVEHQPDQMHIVLLTREDPPLPLPRLRAKGQMTEIRQDDLRFNLQECKEFLENVMGLKISENDIAALERRTEGWIAGLQLAALSLQGEEDPQHFIREFTGSSRYVLDYLIEEVFARQPGEIQDFLLNTAILDRLSGPLCDAVTDNPGGHENLITLERSNLFIIPLDQSRSWYRYHRLFRDLLCNKLSFLGEDHMKSLHLRASRWFESHNLILEAIQHRLAAEDWATATNLLHSANDSLLKSGEVFTLLNWYSQIPDEVICSNPDICLDYAWPLILSGQFEGAESYLKHAEELSGDAPTRLGEVITAQAYLARSQGDHHRMIELSLQAQSYLSKEDIDSHCLISTNLGIAYWHSGQLSEAESALRDALYTARATSNHYAESTALIFQGMTMAVRGRLREAAQRFQGILQGDDHPHFIRGLANLYLSVLHYEWNHLESSGSALQDAIEIAEHIQNDELLTSSQMMMAQIHIATGNITAARDLLEKAQQRAAQGAAPLTIIPRLAAAQVYAALEYDDLAGALGWAEHLGEESDFHSFCRFTNLTQARLLLAQKKKEEAAQYLAKSYEKSAQNGWGYAMIATRALQSLSATEIKTAVDFLEDGLQSAHPEGFIRTFVDLGKPLKPLLEEIIRRKVMTDYAEKILLALNDKTAKTRFGQSFLIEPLSQRELDVLRLMAAGLTNREIAKKLVISTGTAKTHVHNICGKLEVRNRTEAAARALELNLV